MHYNTKAPTDEVCLHAKVHVVHVYLGSVVRIIDVCNFVIRTVTIISYWPFEVSYTCISMLKGQYISPWSVIWARVTVCNQYHMVRVAVLVVAGQ